MNVPQNLKCRVLVIEDQNLLLDALVKEFEAAFSRLGTCLVQGALTLEQGQDLMRECEFDIVITDLHLPGFNVHSSKDRMSVLETVVAASPDSIHIVLTGFDSAEEAYACKERGAAGYVAKTGLDRHALGDILEEISEADFSMRLSSVIQRAPHFRYSELDPSEQEILDYMLTRPKGMKRQDVYDMLAARDGVHAESVQKRYKRMRAKLLKNGLTLPKEL